MPNELTASPARMDLGKIDPREPKKFWFGVKNNTDEYIDGIPWASCGCTVPQLVPSRVPAQGSARLMVEFDPVGKSGLQEKNVGIKYLIDGKEWSISLTFVAQI